MPPMSISLFTNRRLLTPTLLTQLETHRHDWRPAVSPVLYRRLATASGQPAGVSSDDIAATVDSLWSGTVPGPPDHSGPSKAVNPMHRARDAGEPSELPFPAICCHLLPSADRNI